ncbi:MAG: geranylgeranyl reductase family protein [Desulfomonilaceae bacterium]
MPDTLLCDILVVGAGPAGSMAAAAAAREGAKTVLIDAKVRIGEQPHCGEFVPERLFSETAIKRTAIIQRVDYIETRVTTKAKAVARDAIPSRRGVGTQIATQEASGSVENSEYKRSQMLSPGFLIDRVRFDRDLAREAASQGVTVFCSARLLRAKDAGWVVKHGGEQKIFLPGLTIAADGACSTVAAALAMKPPKVLRGLQVEVPLVGPLNKTLVFLDRNFVGGYGWLFPKGKAANVGIGAIPGKQIRMGKMLDQFMETLCREGLIRRGILARSGGLIPVSGIRERLVLDKVVFCGDAAGLTHPITGAGIPQAIFSGELAGRAAAAALKKGDTGYLREYEAEIRRRYGAVINHALNKRAVLTDRWDDPDFEALCEETWIGFKGYKKRIRSLVRA